MYKAEKVESLGPLTGICDKNIDFIIRRHKA
jgi:hypothetical protein